MSVRSLQPGGVRSRLIAAAIRHAVHRGRVPLCLALRGIVSDTDRSVLDAASVSGVVVEGRPDGSAGTDEPFPVPPNGRFVAPGRWLLPPGARHVYLIDSWRRITVAMLREAVRQDVVTLAARYPGGWVSIPLRQLRSLVIARNRLRAAAARRRQRFGTPSPTSSDLPVLRKTAMGPIRVAAPAYDPEPGRIVLVCGSLSPGGAERQVAYTAGLLQGAPGVEHCEVLCDYLTPKHPAKYDFYLPYLASRNVAVRSPDRRCIGPENLAETPVSCLLGSLPEALLVDVANLYHEFIRIRPEVVYAWLDWSNTRAGLAAALAGVPRILLSGRNLNPSRFALYQPYMDIVYRRLCDLPTVRLLNNSEAGARDYASWIGLPEQRVGVIRNAFDPSSPSPTAEDAAMLRDQLGIPRDAVLVGGAFRLSPEKRPLLWVEAAARIARRRGDAWFLICGEGSMRTQIEARARKLGLDRRIVMPGVRADVLTAMRSMDVFLLTSFAEGLPNVLIEAQWLGVPVVATAVGGTPETVEDGQTAKLVSGDDPQEHADAVLALLADNNWRDRAARLGPELVKTRFGMARMLDETLRECFPSRQPALRPIR